MLNIEPTADITELYSITADKICDTKLHINSYLSSIEPLKLVIGTMAMMVGVYYCVKLITGIRNYCRFFKRNLSITVFNLLMLTPWAKAYINNQGRKLEE